MRSVDAYIDAGQSMRWTIQSFRPSFVHIPINMISWDFVSFRAEIVDVIERPSGEAR